MAADPYAVCVCGSGKKLKFCCGDILPDLQRIFRLRDNQPDVAAKQLRDLLKKHPDKDVVMRELATTLLELDQQQEAKQVVADFLKRRPDEPTALLTLAEIMLITDGFDASRRVVHRAFQLCAKNHARHVSVVAARVASLMARRGQILAAREHLVMAVRFASAERQQALFEDLLRLETTPGIPLLLRSAWLLAPVACGEAAEQQDVRARKLSHIGCWEPASIVYNRLADQFPTEGAIWFNLGLCQAWDGRSTEAAASLHHAATLIPSFDLAIEAEALAMQLDLMAVSESYQTVSVQLSVRDLSELLTRLDNEPTIIREESHDHSQCDHGDDLVHAATMMMLNKASSAETLHSTADIAEAIGDIDVYDLPVDHEVSESDNESDPAGPFLEVSSSEHLIDQVIVKLRAIAGDLILTTQDQEKREFVDRHLTIGRPFDRNPYRPPSVSMRRFRGLTIGLETESLENWLQTSTSLLNGKTPLEAADDESLQKKLAACLFVMQSVAAQFDHSPDLVALRERLRLPARTKVAVPAELSLTALPTIQYDRVDAEQLSNSQLAEFTTRATAVGFRSVMRAAFDTLIARAEALQLFGARRAWMMLAAIHRHELRDADVFECLQRARESVEPGTESFRQLLEIDVRELSFRLDDPADPAIKPLLHRFRDKYLRKIPDIADVIAEQLEHAGCGHLIAELSGGLVTDPAATSSLWTPGATQAESEPAAASSLWLPGQ